MGFSSLSALASGVSPASNSVALSVMQLQSARAATNDDATSGKKDTANLGQLFSALSMLQAIGQAILAVSNAGIVCERGPSTDSLQPVIFGVVYSVTVASYPKAVFALAAAMISVAIALVMFIRPSSMLKPQKKHQLIRSPYDPDEDVERGRPRGSKNLSRNSVIPVSASSSGSSSHPSTFSH